MFKNGKGEIWKGKPWEKVMKQKNKLLIKNTIIFAIGNIGARIIFFFLVPLYTNFLSTEEYGISELVITLSELIVPIVTLTIQDGVLRFGLSKNENKNDVIKNGLVIWLLGTVFLILLTPLFSFYKPISNWRWYLSAYIVLKGLFLIEMNYLKVRERNKHYAIISIVQALLLCALNIYLLAYAHLGIRGYLYANIIAFLITDIIVIIMSKTPTSFCRGKFDKQLIIEMLRFSIPMIFTNISWWIINSSDKIMVEAMISAAAVGLYTVAAKIPSLINVMVNIFAQAWGISAVKEYEENNDSAFYTNIYEKYSLLVFGVCIIAVSIMKPFMTIYVGNDFRQAWVYVPLLLVSATFSAIGGFFATLSSTIKKTSINMVTTLIGAALNVFVNFMLIPIIGIWGAVVGTVVAYFVVNISRIVIVRKYISVDINKSKLILNIVLIIIHSIAVSADCYVLMTSCISCVLFVFINYKQIKIIIEKVCKKILSKQLLS